ncbi:MAG TPA: GNAT family N-acetyltransferase [Acidobacteriaceae bacterium]
MCFVIRAAALEDSAEIARVQVDWWRTTTYRETMPPVLDKMHRVQAEKIWRTQLAGGSSRTYVTEMDGSICGFISGGRLRREPVSDFNGVSDFDGEIYAIYIARNAQGRGCGRALMRQLAGKLLQDGLTSAVVWALESDPTCGFYARLGGELVGRKASPMIGPGRLVEVAYGWSDLRLLADAA